MESTSHHNTLEAPKRCFLADLKNVKFYGLRHLSNVAAHLCFHGDVLPLATQRAPHERHRKQTLLRNGIFRVMHVALLDGLHQLHLVLGAQHAVGHRCARRLIIRCVRAARMRAAHTIPNSPDVYTTPTPWPCRFRQMHALPPIHQATYHCFQHWSSTMTRAPVLY